MRCHRRERLSSYLVTFAGDDDNGDTEFRFLAGDVFVISPRARASREETRVGESTSKGEKERESKRKRESM